MPPVGFKRSRALWDQSYESKVAWIRAIMYELQPIRWSKARVYHDSLLVGGSAFVQEITHFVKTSVPAMLKLTTQYIKRMTLRQFGIIAGLCVYYVFLRWIHNLLDAGPVVVIVTCLVGIFTVGLSDEDSDGLSAYSVFNTGFQKLMGSVDADALLQQHVGGGMMALGGGIAQHGGDVRGHDRDDMPAPNERAQRRRQQAADAARQNAADDDVNDNNAEAADPDPQGRARKSGKKARRRDNADQRQDIRLQREAARQMGFGDNDEAAMIRLIEDQAAGIDGAQ